MPPQTNRQMALAQYRLRAGFYDAELAAFEPVRRKAIDSLQLEPGHTVLDIGCGTGLSLELLQQCVGEEGNIVGIEQSPEMFEQASRRVARKKWRNVTLENAPAESAIIGSQADAALFLFTHDILRDAAGIQHLMTQLKPGARVVAAGLQWSAPWDWTTNWLVLMSAMYSTTSLEGLTQPWSHLTEWVGEMQMLPSPIKGVYIVSGTYLPKDSDAAQQV